MKSPESVPTFDQGYYEYDEDTEIRWSDLIFLPFNPVFKKFVLLAVILKSTLGPLQAIFSIIHCSDVMDRDIYLFFIKQLYVYFCDAIYFIDTFLHIVHRQVTDKAMRRECLPKSAFLLVLDVISLIPFYTMMTTEVCPPVQLWPNILAFSEFVIIYRVVDFFSLISTHSYPRLLFGFTILFFLFVNCVTCFLLLLTFNGLCKNCKQGIYDWRSFVINKLNESNTNFTTYVYASTYVLSVGLGATLDQIGESTILEHILATFFMICHYALCIYIVMPKLFAEAVLRLRKICTFHPHVIRIIEETKRRNPLPSAHINVGKFCNIIWKKRSGITHQPEVIGELPRYLRIDIKQDLLWPVFYHSPSLRKTSSAFKRWLSNRIHIDYKLPGEKFFAGPHCLTNIYYLKTGIVELISADDGITPLLSLTGGTFLGDVSCLVPPLKRKVIIRSVTYCEVFILSRYDLLQGMQKYPVDRKNIMASVKDKLKHARTLNTCKQHVKGLDRAEDEGLAWLKRRWWEISEAVANWKKKSKEGVIKCELPPEEAIYHCAKYIGQLVLCTDLQLNKDTLFVSVKFPWILAPNTIFIAVWKKIVMFTVFVALITYPPNLTSGKVSNLFVFIKIWTDLIYSIDICITLMTASTKESVSDNFTAVMFAQCKTTKFALDIISSIWIELLVLLAGMPEYYNIFQMNRLIKVYVLHSKEYVTDWSVGRGPFINVCYKVILKNFCFIYIGAYLMYFLVRELPDLTDVYFFGVKIADQRMDYNFLDIVVNYVCEMIFVENYPTHLIDIFFAVIITYIGFIVFLVTKFTIIAYLYLKYRQIVKYQSLVTNLKKYYKHYKIHHYLLKRLDRYLVCQWKYYNGADILQPNLLKREPFDIYWKVHGEVAEKIISGSKPFSGADPVMIRELTYATTFLIMPKNSTISIFGVQCRNVTWIVQGHIKCEYHNETGEILKSCYNPGEMVSVLDVLLKKPSLRTYTTASECELIIINVQDFFKIIRRYPHEWSYFQNCIDECGPVFENIVKTYIKKHKDYLEKLREKIFRSLHTQPSEKLHDSKTIRSASFVNFGKVAPDSDFIYYWMMFRAFTVIVCIMCAAVQGGSGAVIRWPLTLIVAFCDCIAWIDIILKLFMSYYNEKGILINDTRMCMRHYLSRGFLLDIVGAVPWYMFYRMIVLTELQEQQEMMMTTFSKMAHIYIVIAFFDHIADWPTINSVYVLLIKWQIVIIILVFGSTQYLMNCCIDFKYDTHKNLLDMKTRNSCWMPNYIMELDEKPTYEQLHLLYAQSFNFVHSAFMKQNIGYFYIDRSNTQIGLMLIIIGVINWCVVCYSVTMLVLLSRYNTVFQHGVIQLKRFLKAERVDKKLIDDVVSYFAYWWLRNKGIDRKCLMNERIGIVFRQDLNYYFYRRTLEALDTLLHAGKQIHIILSSLGHQWYMRPGQEILREMDLSPYVCIVHRGKVTINQNGMKLAELTKGSIFGQLTGTKSRPVRISAVAQVHTDLLRIPISQFHETITDEIRSTIRSNPQSQQDFMAIKDPIYEDPYNTMEYILRRRKTIQLPWMEEPAQARRNSWYARCLLLTWVVGPFVSAATVLLLSYFPEDYKFEIFSVLFVFDVVHLAHLITEFYTVELTVVNNALVKRCIGLRLIKCWRFYADFLSLVLPPMTFWTGNYVYQLARLLRLRLFYDFYVQFCTGFKSRLTTIFMKFIIVVLLIHAITCGWIHEVCRNKSIFNSTSIEDLPEFYEMFDLDEWVDIWDRAEGCSRAVFIDDEERLLLFFVVPRMWYNDYIVAFTYIVLLLTQNELETIMVRDIKDAYYKTFIHWFVLILDLWLISNAISSVYTKFRELLQYDYGVKNLITYLKHSGLSPYLLHCVREYTHQLWQRQRGNWLPELAVQAPQCLQEDLLCALYLHHLQTSVLFKDLPMYFIRQVAARFQRVVIFPGKCIVLEGDIFPTMFFIHEGEVEKWFTDSSGRKRMLPLLSTNEYFGIVPGLFPNETYQFTFYTRTVVDLVYLSLNLWQDLLDAYPDIRADLYKTANNIKKEILRNKTL